MPDPTRYEPPLVLGPDVQAHLGRKLKSFYNALLVEPLPDRFDELLGQIEARERANGARNDLR